jgi:hypothetical protein
MLGMLGQLCAGCPELPGLAEFDGAGLAEGLALAALATARVPKPVPNPSATAIAIRAIVRRSINEVMLVTMVHLLLVLIPVARLFRGRMKRP